ncbi:MAG TPA: TIM barrel protein [Ferruginibacter sp.]|nr:TIM barrel protein [Ferruginibacter sp.]HMP19843.1 TIM barrel protein [Ferruginibacter sp.]
MAQHNSRRKALQQIALAPLALSSLSSFTPEKKTPMPAASRINHSVCKWTYDFLTLEELCVVVKQIGFSAIDLLTPKEWPIAQKHGIYCSMCYIAGEVSLTKGFNNPQYHAALVKDYLEVIPLMVKAGYKNLICFSGNREGMDDETGLKNCVKGLQQILPAAEKNGIIIQMELFNSKVDHAGYMADKSAWGVELCKRLGSENFKLLYDIYHMQVNEGDVIHTIKDNHQYFGHYHTAGVPGRHEINETQELFYPAIMKAIADTGFTGYVAQEYIPTGKTKAEKITALKDAVQRCTIA